MSDLISRQVALDALTEYWKGISDRHPTLDGEMAVYADCKGIIKRLPSAQPEIIRCKDCKYYLLGHDDRFYCFKHDDDILWQDDSFCSCTERKEEQHEID